MTFTPRTARRGRRADFKLPRKTGEKVFEKQKRSSLLSPPPNVTPYLTSGEEEDISPA